MNVKILCLFLICQVTLVLSKGSLCPFHRECECLENGQRIYVTCERVNRLSYLKEVFCKNCFPKPVTAFIMKKCEASTFPNIFSSVAIEEIRSSCPINEIENGALASIRSLKVLNLHSTEFRKLPKAISELRRLKMLSMIDGKLIGVDTELQDLPDLLKLKLAGNDIRQISYEAFSWNSKINIIDLSRNKLVFLYPGTFDNCQKLMKVSLKSNYLSSVDGLFTVPSLQEVNIRDNNIESIDNAFQHESNLEHLDAGKNRLYEISDSAFSSKMRNLRILILDNCELAFLPFAIFNSITKLEKIDLSFNRLESLPFEIFRNLNNLVEVKLKQNQITHLGDVFIHNTRLESIILSSNYISSCEDIFLGLNNLKNIDLRDNKLRVVTKNCFPGLRMLTTLQLSKNIIYRIDREAFTNLIYLKKLKLSHNKLENLDGCVRNMSELEVLHLSHNVLTEVGENELKNLSKLKKLYLGFNHISTVNRSFRNLVNLETLSMSKNKLTTLTRGAFPEDFTMKRINLSGKETFCSSNKECECIKNTYKIIVNCQRVNNMNDVQNIFSKDLNFQRVSIFRTKSCIAKSISNSIFWNTTIKEISCVCPFEQIENDALTPIQGLTKLELRFTKFSKIPIAISELFSLKILYINDGKLTGVDTELQNMPYLRTLKLINNDISEISLEAFSKSPNLSSINLSQNKLIFLYPGIFDGCRKLNKIFLQKNSLKSVDGLFNIPSLKVIHLEMNKLTSIDNAFQRDINLEYLHLSRNPLKEIRSSAFSSNIKHLRVLALRNCELKFLQPSIFWHLTKLKLLDLSNNAIESLPVDIFHGLHMLLQVNLNENRISYLGEVFRHNRHLQKIMLSSNNLQTLQNLFRGLQFLRTVELKHNNLTVITGADFSTTISMRTLELSNNSIYRIDSNAFQNMVGLRNLSLDFNKLTTLNGSLRNSLALKVLLLNHNRLKEIGPSEMSNLKKLTWLNLSFNNLKNIHKAFRNLTHLRNLNLYSNNLTTLSRDTFPPRFVVNKFRAAGNKWICDCRLMWILNLETSTALASRIKCSEPQRFFGKTLRQLTALDLMTWSENCD
ncbi:unnamed protein product [Larinioides sclopetarius]|uniref:Chaoptin n=1 Tax=Larinioides sclopetarius TaxID=280406 RepID=A0AAV2A1Z5_9ARAC